jgi:hypothetical protein
MPDDFPDRGDRLGEAPAERGPAHSSRTVWEVDTR